LRAAFSSQNTELIESLVEASFIHLINIINALSHPFGIVSPSLPIINRSEQLGATFTFQDSGTNLNKALSRAIKNLPQEKPILIVMPDLPFITQEFLYSLLSRISNEDVIIIPSISGNDSSGTAILFLKHPNLLTFQFGENSNLKFQKEAENSGLKYQIIHSDPFARDLDTLDDVRYLKQHIKMVYEPDRFVRLLGLIS
jgi:2-phospho-L-lactate guanylyltransferase